MTPSLPARRSSHAPRPPASARRRACPRLRRRARHDARLRDARRHAPGHGARRRGPYGRAGRIGAGRAAERLWRAIPRRLDGGAEVTVIRTFLPWYRRGLVTALTGTR